MTHDLERDSTLQISWDIQFTDFKTDPFVLQRLDNNWVSIHTIENPNGVHVDYPLITESESYTYRITDSGPCPEDYSSREHTSMVLSVDKHLFLLQQTVSVYY